MIRHVCMFEFLDEAEGRSRAENVAITKSMLEALPAKIDWIRESEVHLKSENAPAGNWDLILISEFDSFEDLERLGSMNAVREAGLYRSEGKDYVMKDGDIVLFRFNV